LQHSEKGSSGAEYGILSATIALTLIIAISGTGSQLRDTFFELAEFAGFVSSEVSGVGEGMADLSMAPREGGIAPGEDAVVGGGDILPPERQGVLPEGWVAPSLNLNPGFTSYADPGLGDNFVDVNFAGYMVQSDHFLANGLYEPVDLTLLGHSSARMSIGGGSDVVSGTIAPRQSLILRIEPPSSYSETREVLVMAGDDPFAHFSVTTRALPDLVADPFGFDEVLEAELASTVVIGTRIIRGIEVNQAPSATGVGYYDVPVEISGEGDPQVMISGSGEWVRSGRIRNGQSLQVRMQSSESGLVRRQATVSVGGVHSIVGVTTRVAGNQRLSFAIPAGNLGTFDLSDRGNLVSMIGIFSTRGEDFNVTVNPAGFSGTSLQLRKRASGNQSGAFEGPGIDIVCHHAPRCVGTFTFEAAVHVYNPNETFRRNFEITLVP